MVLGWEASQLVLITAFLSVPGPPLNFLWASGSHL